MDQISSGQVAVEGGAAAALARAAVGGGEAESDELDMARYVCEQRAVCRRSE